MISILFILVLVLVLILIAYGYYKTSDILEVIHLKEFNLKEFQGLRNMNIPILFNMEETCSNIYYNLTSINFKSFYFIDY